jgi:hypothetical protein
LRRARCPAKPVRHWSVRMSAVLVIAIFIVVLALFNLVEFRRLD